MRFLTQFFGNGVRNYIISVPPTHRQFYDNEHITFVVSFLRLL